MKKIFTCICLVIASLMIFFVTLAPLYATEENAGGAFDVLTPTERSAEPVFNALSDRVELLMKEHKAPGDAKELKKLQSETRPLLLSSLGLNPPPPDAPLNVVVTGRTEMDGYTIENVVYENFPGMYVSANVYVPKNLSGPAPAVLNPVGHWRENGKNEPVVQDRCISLAKMGFVAITFDPVGQGERLIDGNSHDWGFNLLLTGHAIEGVMVWDTMRALDYLLTRPDVDPKRIGVTGASGGGENSFYSAAADPRIAVSVPVVFLNDYEIWVREGGPHCICNHIPGIFKYASEVTIGCLIAPRPLMPVSGVMDPIFPIKGAEKTAKTIAGIYKALGVPDDFRFVKVSTQHGYFQQMRESMYVWMSHWLRGSEERDKIKEPEHKILDPKDPAILAFKTDEYTKKTLTLKTLGARWAENLPEKTFPAGTPAEWESTKKQLRKSIIDVFGAAPETSPVKFEERGATACGEGYFCAKQVLWSEGIPVPAVTVMPANAAVSSAQFGGPVVIVVSRAGKKASFGSLVGKALLAKGAALFLPDLRGYGETFVSSDRERMIVTDSIMLGEPVFGGRVRDIIRSVDYLTSRPNLGVKSVGCYGKGEDGWLCLYAAALDDRISAVAMDGSQLSYKETFASNMPPSPAGASGALASTTGDLPQSAFVPGVLKEFDIPQLMAAVAPRRIVIADAPAGQKNKYKGFPEQVYSLEGAAESLIFAGSGKKNAAIAGALTAK